MDRLKKKKWIFLMSFLLIVISCERKFEFFEFNCEDCYQEKPEYGPLIIYFSFNDENDFVLYTIYKGKFENRIEEYVGTAFIIEEQIEVPVNEYYSVEAKYISGTDTIYVVDGDRFDLERENSKCDKKCYYFKGGIIDVRLKE
ncbi:hypothetical protein [Maribellus mangrovi]|uniref:hypothetical protein n=1 Tax=Maribellus mangrovi TaxID=3133146 RepID=UPI0030EBDF83